MQPETIYEIRKHLSQASSAAYAIRKLGYRINDGDADVAENIAAKLFALCIDAEDKLHGCVVKALAPKTTGDQQ